jgi:hypothetical protein
MRTICCLLLVAMTAVAPAFADTATPLDEKPAPATPATAAPVVVLIERNPWLMVFGSDSPTFALYDDGAVIYADPARKAYVSARLSKAEASALLQDLALTKLVGLDANYSTSDWSDQPTNELTFWDSRSSRRTWTAIRPC